ncbi:MAG TPA: hypothetical protein VMV47_07630 [Bacteroidales bacterium]|nr:hypothetical protein [Bacteroidales bacterium]
MSDLLLFRACNSDAMWDLIHQSGHDKITALNIDTDVLLSEWMPRVDFVRYGDVLKKEDLDQVGMESLKLAQNWYKVNGKDATLIEGLSFGQYIDYEMNRVLKVSCRQIAFLDVYKPARIFMADDNSLVNQVTRAYAKSRNLTIVSVPVITYPTKFDWYLPKQNSPANLLRKTINKVYCFYSNLFSKHLMNNDYMTLYVQSHPYTSSFIDYIINSTNHNIVIQSIRKKYFGNKRVICSDTTPLLLFKEYFIAFEEFMRSLDLYIETHNSFDFNGISLWPIIKELYSINIKKSYYEFNVRIRYLQWLFTTVKIDVVVLLQDSVGEERILVMLAKILGIPSIYVTHGIVAYLSKGFPCINADVVFTYGKSCSDLLKEMGEAKSTKEVGNSYFHTLKNVIVNLKSEALLKKYNIELRPVFLFTAEPYGNFYSIEEPSNQNLILQSVCRVAKLLTNAYFIIRLHPSTFAYENIDIKKNIISSFNLNNVLLDPGMRLEEALSICDITITATSTLGIQTIVAGKGIVVFDPLKYDGAKYIKDNAGVVANTEEELLIVLKRIITDNKYRKDIYNMGQEYIKRKISYYEDFDTNKRMMAEIQNIVNKSHGEKY